MNRNTVRRIIYLAALIGLLIGTRYFQGIGKHHTGQEDPISDMRSNEVIYTHHARCRMDCRDISKAEILETLANGQWNNAKSDLNDRPCPTYALEDRTADGQSIRVIFAACEDVVKVVTAIDLDRQHQCNCD